MSKRVLLDESVPQPLRRYLAGHTVITAAYKGWAGKKNGELVALTEEADFDVMVTADQSLNYQQNLKRCKLALVVLSTNQKDLVLANAAQPGSFTFVDLGR